MDLSLRTETWTQGDQSWLGSQHGTETARSITLDVAAFTAATHYPQGYFPSGLTLGRNTDTGLYGPYDADADDGTENFAGFLFEAIKAPASGRAIGALLMHCFVVEYRLPAGHGLDDAAKTAAAGRIIFV